MVTNQEDLEMPRSSKNANYLDLAARKIRVVKEISNQHGVRILGMIER